MRKETKIARIPKKFEDALMRAGDLRVSKGLMKSREVNLRKLLELQMTTPAFKDSLFQLSSWPEKKK